MDLCSGILAVFRVNQLEIDFVFRHVRIGFLHSVLNEGLVLLIAKQHVGEGRDSTLLNRTGNPIFKLLNKHLGLLLRVVDSLHLGLLTLEKLGESIAVHIALLIAFRTNDVEA